MEPLIDPSSGTTEMGVDTTAPRSRLRRTRGPDVVVSLDGSGPRYQQIYRSLRAMILAQCGAEVTVVTTAREALEKAPFDVLVSDILMPEENGYDLIRKVRALDVERGGRIPALALTAYARIEDREAALSAGYQQHAAKPIEPVALAGAVATLAGRSERSRSERAC